MEISYFAEAAVEKGQQWICQVCSNSINFIEKGKKVNMQELQYYQD